MAKNTRGIDSARILSWWEKLNGLPFGTHLFSLGIGLAVPYTHSIRAEVIELEKGFCRVKLRDRRRVRNHLNSIHAIALANLCECASGLALITSLSPQTRGILTGFSVRYLKKARGSLIAESRTAERSTNETATLLVEVAVTDSQGELVTKATAEWLVGPQ